MIAQLRGTVVQHTPGRLILDVAGVGYLVGVPDGARLARQGNEATVHTHLVVREDAMDLYGFTSVGDRDLFQLLLSVSGIGPKIALAAVDALGADGIRAAVIAEDVSGLTTISGVGKKGAQRMILELRSKVGGLPVGAGATAMPGGVASADDPRSEARLALSSLGYGAAEVEHALRSVASDGSTETMIRQALKGLA